MRYEIGADVRTRCFLDPSDRPAEGRVVGHDEEDPDCHLVQWDHDQKIGRVYPADLERIA